MASPFEIEQAVHELLDQPYDPTTFLPALAQAFGATESWAKRVADGSGPKSPVADGGVLWVKKFHGLTCAPGTLDARFSELLDTSSAKRKLAFRFAIATDGQGFKALDTLSGETLNCDLDDVRREFWFLKALAGYDDYVLPKESEVDMQASAMLRRLYDTLIRANPDWTTAERQHDLNQFMTRVIFCLFAEDVGIFEDNLFSRTVQTLSDDLAQGLDDILAAVFAVMNVPEGERGAIPPWQAAFPYVNGGLFGSIESAETVAIPTFNRAARRYLLDAGEQDWGAINPDIFGSMIQAIVDEEERAEGGLHYTSVPNIMKVLGPLFLDDVRAELTAAWDSPKRLTALSNRLGRIRVFDPACGSGNFLVIAYRELREIENELLQRLANLTGKELGTFTNIHLKNFYGIELRDFATETARLSLYVAQFQMNERFRELFGFAPKALPLTEMGQIHGGNALRMDWEAICPPVEGDGETVDTFICGNPPYKGSTWQTKAQKADLEAVVAGRVKSWKSLDYVSGWFIKGAAYCANGHASLALVSTNSICQGQQVPILWPLIFDMGVEIHMAQTSFKWANLASQNAGVTVVIVGLAKRHQSQKLLMAGETRRVVNLIGPYLVPYVSEIVFARGNQKDRPELLWGNKPADGGFLVHSYAEFLQISSNIGSKSSDHEFIRIWGASEVISGLPRYFLAITAKPAQESLEDILEKVRNFRNSSTKAATRKFADRPHEFVETRFVVTNEPTLLLPGVTSEQRRFLTPVLTRTPCLPSNKSFGLRGANLWTMAILSARLHASWVETICTRLRTDPSYTNTLCWNTFPLPELTALQKDELTARAEEILLVRERHFPKSIAQLYDPEAMPEDLRAAHRRNDEVLERIYIGRPFKNDTERLEHLFKRYAKMVKQEAASKSPDLEK